MAGFRGPSGYVAGGASLGTGGNQVMNAQTGTVSSTSIGGWHPTILYLFALLVVEWVVLVWLQKYI